MDVGERIHVIGVSGSGKTTLASRIAHLLDIPHVELDSLHWGPDWTPVPLEVFRVRTAQALSGDRWAVDGNYSKVRDIVWSRADTVVWLDYPLRVIMGRLAWRTLRRVVTREALWGGNRELVWMTLFSRDSILLWALQTYRRRRQEYPALLAQPEHAHLRVVRLRSPQKTESWLVGLARQSERDQT
jgi:adenylate kinase family enzyme